MNFKERIRQALKNPNKYSSGGYIKNDGGGDKVVYGARHSQGGVMRDGQTELEGGGFTASGQPKAGEVITTVYDDGGNPQEFYMSYKNGVAQKYLEAKEQTGGQLSQGQKQYFAKMNESKNPNGSPSEIAANGGMKKYFMGGVDLARDNSNMGFDGMGSHQAAIMQQSVSKKSGYQLENGGMSDQYGMGGAYEYEHGGPHNEGEFFPNPNQNVQSQVKNEEQRIQNIPVEEKAFRDAEAEKWAEVFNGQNLADAAGMTGIPVVSEVGDLVSAAISTSKGNYDDALLSLTAISVPVVGGAAIKATKDQAVKLLNKTWHKVKNNKLWINPVGGWNTGAKKVTETVIKVKGKPGNYTPKSKTPMINYVDRTRGEQAINVAKKTLKLGTAGTVGAFGYNYMGGTETPTGDMNYGNVGKDFTSLVNSPAPDTTATPDTARTNVQDLSVTTEENKTQDSIPYTEVGQNLTWEGQSWKRLPDGENGELNWDLNE